ncbi:hypothetical protein SLEP1_g28408 [Rubroshorea leprosula]|uniref:Uncharacterized protein n=1 Tax=Rubroshorea leprosula TaxID=152421 RepID=A0AAV5K4H1_9ROSI|nr:hypothetical protein SLEP1_g28408 [Rubroshorea leprosula]
MPSFFVFSKTENILVLSEETDGNRSDVNFKTVTVGTVCGYASENNTLLELSCHSAMVIQSLPSQEPVVNYFTKGICEWEGDEYLSSFNRNASERRHVPLVFLKPSLEAEALSSLAVEALSVNTKSCFI